MLAFLIRLVVRLWIATLRVERSGPAFIRPAVLVFWHGDQLPLLRIRPAPPAVVPVSLSRDGALQAQILGGLGLTCVRGSSSRGGAMAVRGLLRALHGGASVLMAVDGPRGPRGVAKPGAAFVAISGRVPVYPVAVEVAHGRRLARAWDAFLLPLPFTRTRVRVGDPLTATANEDAATFTARIEAALHALAPRP